MAGRERILLIRRRGQAFFFVQHLNGIAGDHRTIDLPILSEAMDIKLRKCLLSLFSQIDGCFVFLATREPFKKSLYEREALFDILDFPLGVFETNHCWCPFSFRLFHHWFQIASFRRKERFEHGCSDYDLHHVLNSDGNASCYFWNYRN